MADLAVKVRPSVATRHTSFYVTGGTLRRNAPSYVQRRADKDLYEGLSRGEFCYVLTSRQRGKSSLMVRTAVRLREDGAAVAVLDLTAIGQNLTAEYWYSGLLGRMGLRLEIEDELEDFWLTHERLGPLQRWMLAITEVVLKKFTGRVVIFIDEIDAVRSLPFSTDEFFAAIREFYNRRTEDPELERLTFCLLGVATPSDLIRDTRTTPFNVGQRIELTDFTEREAQPLAAGLGRSEKLNAILLRRVIYWTGGHPYLTQRLCQAVAQDQGADSKHAVDRLCEELFLSSRARESDDNLLFVQERLLRSEADRSALLDLYARVRQHKHVRDDEFSPLVSVLHLSGITRVVDNYLQVRNRIYYRVFDRDWITANMPDAELRRQRVAYRRGLVRAASVGAIILLVMAGLAFSAHRQKRIADQNREFAEQERVRADQNAKRLASTLEERELALGEARTQREIAEKQRERAEVQRQEAYKQKQIAEAATARALAAQQAAERQRKIANDRAVEAEQQRERAEDQTKVATSTLFNVIRFLVGTGEKRRAVEYLKQLAQVYRQADKNVQEAETILNISEIYLQLKDESKAEEYFNQGLKIFRDKRDPTEEGHVLLKIGDLYRASGAQDKATAYYTQALRSLEEALPALRNDQKEAYALYYLSLTHSALHNDRKALDYLNRALSIFQSLRDPVMVDIIGIRIEELSQSLKEN
ncbi:MAG TPA: AAA-like domain-containing protein [Pyrinomonadaceae bacterium]|nr:AAA-like domain-containing protein [Pyrinomonadaceae bacterium]